MGRPIKDLSGQEFGQLSAEKAWDAPSWRDKDRNGRRLSVEIEPKRLARLRRLLLSETSLERAWHELNRGDGQAPQALVEALMYGLRRGVEELTKPDALQRLSQLSQAQLLEVCDRLQNFKPSVATAWTPEGVDALVELWSKVHQNG